MALKIFGVLICAYLLGSFPSAYIITRLLQGLDIRQIGDGNVGAKNTFQYIGWLPGLIVLILDIGKGMLAVAMVFYLNMSEDIAMLAGACTVLGHDFSIFLRLQGGQGMATLVGVFSILFPYQMILTFCIFLMTLAITHNWDLSCAVGSLFLLVIMWLFGQPLKRVIYIIFLIPSIGIKKFLQTRHAHRMAT